MKLSKTVQVILMSLGVIMLFLMTYSFIVGPVVRKHGSIRGGSAGQNMEALYDEFKVYCSSIGLASGQEGLTPEWKTTLFAGEYEDLENVYIVARFRRENDTQSCAVGYSLNCSYPRWSGSGSEDYKKLIEEFSQIIRKEE